jgi:uracil-DNA glycosylase family 4
MNGMLEKLTDMEQTEQPYPSFPAPTPEPEAATPKVCAEPFEVPENWNVSRRHQDRVVVAGRGSKQSSIMFLSSSVLEEEVLEEEQGTYGAVFKRKPAYLKGPHGAALKDMCMSVGVAVDSDVYYTAVCKWLLPKETRLNPKAGDISPGLACLRRELTEVKPKIVVAFGKAAFEFLVPIRFKFGDAIGAWFWSDEFQCRVMPMNHQYYVAAKPEWMERFRMDMAQVKQALDESRGILVNRIPLHYRTVTNAAELRQLVKDLQPYKLLCPDCEWHGRSHASGQLRSLQIGWLPGHAAYIRFMDDKLNYVFDVDYRAAGAILAEVWDQPDVELVGHHISADLPWLAEWLGLTWWGKTRLDTEFAYQCCNEHGDRGLERMSLRYTDLGRYEMELEFWKKDHRADVEGGYGLIPDEILIPYALRDVDVPLRALPYIEKDLEQQGMLEYYRTIMNPFVTDVFTQFAITGLPMNMELMDEMRMLYGFVYQEMERIFRDNIYAEAWLLLARNAVEMLPNLKGLEDAELRRTLAISVSSSWGPRLRQVYEDAMADAKDAAAALRVFLQESMGLPLESLSKEEERCIVQSIEHAHGAAGFNLRSVTDMRRWLFDVKGYTPVKSTANKAKGVPATDWAKVMSWKPAKREGLVPAVDKQTLQILSAANQDPVLMELLELNAVGNIRKAFLKEPERNEAGEITEEAGLHAWVAPDKRVHGQMSMTETSRPRAWNPNSLNWPSYVQDRILSGMARILEYVHAEGRLPAIFQKYLKQKLPALRHCVQAPPGLCFVESDFQTAEVLGLAYISGDENLIRIMTEPDQQFAITTKGEKVRVGYASDCGIAPRAQEQRFIMSVWEEGKFIRNVQESELKRNPDGSLRHPKADLHWSLAEMFQERPRELMTNKKDRGAGKAGNFKTAYGSTPGTLERSIEADTGFKPEPGTGEKILTALEKRQPKAVAFLNAQEDKVLDPGYLRAASGKLRHFVAPPNVYGLSSSLTRSIISAQAREARNYFMQESVAATALRAAYWLMQFKRRYNLEGVPITVLYDSVVTMCPYHERKLWAKAHELCMYRANGWEYHGRVLNYSIDTEVNAGWSLPYKYVPGQRHMDALLSRDEYAPTPSHLRAAEAWLDSSNEFFKQNPRASLNTCLFS